MKNIHYVLKAIKFALAILPILGNAMVLTSETSKNKPPKKKFFSKSKEKKKKNRTFIQS